MIVEVNGRIWADTPGVQAAVTKFHGEHLNFGDFVVAVGDQDVYFERMDGTLVGDAIAERHSFIGRPHRVEGDARAIDTVIEELRNKSKVTFEAGSDGRLLCPECGAGLYATVEVTCAGIPAFVDPDQGLGLDCWSYDGAAYREADLALLWCRSCRFLVSADDLDEDMIQCRAISEP